MRIISKARNQAYATMQQAAPTKARKGLSVRKVGAYLRFSVFVVLVGMFYIWNSHEAEQQIKEMEAYRREIKDLKSRYLLQQSTLSAGVRFSELKSELDTLGLRPLREPAYKIVKGAQLPLSRLEAPERSEERKFKASTISSITDTISVNERRESEAPPGG